MSSLARPPSRLAAGFAQRALTPRTNSTALITGAGLITPIGRDFDETWNALLADRFINDHARSAGEFHPSIPRIIQMARRAADQATSSAHWRDQDVDAVIVGTSKGSIESWIEAGGPSPAGLGDIAHALTSDHTLRLTLSGACASGLMALIRGAMLIESGQARRVLIVAAEASVHPLFIVSFQRLGVLPRAGVGCRPFDVNRDGFLMSEAAAAVCLESSRSIDPTADRSGQGGLVAIDRFALGADAAHLTAGAPDGRVLRHLLARVIDHRPVDLIHAHGTGTVINDPIELSAIESVLDPHSPPPCVYSHKAALGHSLGAAGLVSVVLNLRAHRDGVVPGNVRTTEPLPTRRVTLSNHATHRPVQRSIALAAGFGGAMAIVSMTNT
jgi:3-oxoacyl-[acyl-carrier-protein] synthase II